MRSKFWYLTGVSLKKKIKTKWFLIANILLCLGIILIANFESVISYFGGDFNDDINIVVVDKTNYTIDIFKKNLKNTNNLIETESKTKVALSKEPEEKVREDIKDTDKILIVFESSNTEYLKAKIISDGLIDSLYYNTLIQTLTMTKAEIAMSLTNINVEELNKITSPINIERIVLNDEKATEDDNMTLIMSTVFPTIILPFFILVILLVQMIGAEINEEKQTRSMEVIISNVSPNVHFFSKVLSSNVFVILQSLLLFIYASFGIGIRFLFSSNGNSQVTSFADSFSNIWNTIEATGFVDKLNYIIPLTIILLVLSFLAYSLVAGILASMTVNMEDYQQIQSPILFVSLVGYYLSIMASMFKGSVLIRILSYVPFISSLLSPALLIIGDIGIIDVIVSIIFLCIFIFIAIKYGLKIYKVGILNYSTDKMWSKLFKAAKSKDFK